MTSIQIDRTDGLSSSTAIKGPCKAATTANITLSGEQTIDGVSVATGDRVLVKNQTNAADNGIYVVDTGPWRRAKDFSSNRDVRKGTAITVASGSANIGFWQVTTADPITIGSTNIVFAQLLQPYTPLAPNMAAFLAGGTSALLAAAVSDETGSGSLVFANAPTLVGPVTVNPPAASLSQGLVITQTGPTSGSTAGPTAFNTETITYSSSTTGAGSDSFGVGNAGVFGHRINFVVSGANVGGSLIRGLGVHTLINSTAAFNDGVSIVGTAMVNAAATNTGTIEGMSANVIVNNGGSVTRIAALEASATINTGGSATNRAAVVLSSNGNVAGGTLDAALMVSSTTSAGLFKNFVTFSSGWLGNHGVASSANLFNADNALTVANVFNFSNVTVSSNILNFPNVTLSGAGALTVAVSATAPIHYGGSAAGSSLTLQSTSNGAPSGDSIVLKTGGATRAIMLSSGNLGLGLETNPQTQLVVSQNTKTGLPAITSAIGYFVGADASDTFLQMDTYGAAKINAVIARAARGTAAAPTKSLADDTLFSLGARSYDNSGAFSASNVATINFSAGEDQNGTTNHGSYITLNTTPNASGTRAEAIRILGAGNVKFSSAANFSANGSVATVLGSLGPTGSHTTVQKWLTIVDNGSVTGYIPVF